MKVSVLISHYRQDDYLRLTLAGYLKQTEPDFELIICNDDAAFASDATVAEFTARGLHLRVAHNDAKQGYQLAKMWNRGANLAQGERLVFTNADVYPSPRFIAGHAGQPKYLAIAGYYHHLPEDRIVLLQSAVDPYRFLLEYRVLDERVDPRRGLERDVPCDAGKYWGGNLGVSAAVFRSVGGFDERIPDYPGEDTDLGIRLALHGCLFVLSEGAHGYHLDHPKMNEVRGRGSGRSIAYLNAKWGNYKRYQKLGVRALPDWWLRLRYPGPRAIQATSG